MNIQQLLMTYGGAGGAVLNNAIIASGASYVGAWPWTTAGGFGARFTNPSPLPPGTSYGAGVDVNKARNAVAFGGDSTTFPVYPWSDSGFGTKYANPSTLPVSTIGESNCPSFNGNDTAIALTQNAGNNANDRLSAWQWNNSTGFGTKYTDTTSISNNHRFVKFSPDNAYIVASLNLNERIKSWPWNDSTGFGTANATPSSTAGSSAYMVDVSPDSAYSLLAFDFDPWVYAYPMGATGSFGTRFSNPSTAIFSQGYGSSARWNRAGNCIALTNGYQGGPNYMQAIGWGSSGGFGTKFAAPSSAPGYESFAAIFNRNDTAVFCTVRGTGNPNVVAYAWNNSTGFGTKYANPPSITANASVFNSAFV